MGARPRATACGRSAAPPEEIEADLFVIGPEAPLVNGLADRLRALAHAGLRSGGGGRPSRGLQGPHEAARRGGRGADGGLRGARHAADAIIAYLRRSGGPYVVKTDGLAAGKGVLVTDDLAHAEEDVTAKLSGAALGPPGDGS